MAEVARVSLYGLVGGYALSGRGPRWARVISGALALTAIPIWALTVTSFAGPDLALDTPRGAWVAVYYWSFLTVHRWSGSPGRGQLLPMKVLPDHMRPFQLPGSSRPSIDRPFHRSALAQDGGGPIGSWFGGAEGGAAMFLVKARRLEDQAAPMAKPASTSVSQCAPR